MYETVLVASRGPVARSVVRTCQRLGVRAVTVHSEGDADALHVVEADDSVLIGPAPPEQRSVGSPGTHRAASPAAT